MTKEELLAAQASVIAGRKVKVRVPGGRVGEFRGIYQEDDGVLAVWIAYDVENGRHGGVSPRHHAFVELVQ